MTLQHKLTLQLPSIFSRSVALLALATLVLFSFMPGAKRCFHTRGPYHSVGHFIAFFVTAFLLCLGFRPRSSRLTWTCILLATAVLIETGQHFVFYTPLEFSDVIWDCFGALVGASLGLLDQESNLSTTIASHQVSNFVRISLLRSPD